MSSFYNPVQVIQSDNWEKSVNKMKMRLNIVNPIVVTSSGNKDRLKLASIFNQNSIFCLNKSNPTFDDCNEIISFCSGKSFDGVIALGGGSSMDLAKVAIAFISHENSNLIELINYKEEYKHLVPSIFIPTTHGTGSEVTMWGTIWNMEEKKKYSISNHQLYPRVSVLDGNLTLSLPLDITLMTTMDAMTHSFEAIWNKTQNSISNDYATESISLIIKYIDKLKKDLGDIAARKKLLLASNLAGLAFSHTKTAAAHAISYPLTIRYGIPHGIAVFFSLIPLLEKNKPFIENSLKVIYKKCSLNYEGLKKHITSIPQNIFEMKLSNWGVKENDIQKLARESFNSTRIKNNIIQLKESDVQKIIYKNF